MPELVLTRGLILPNGSEGMSQTTSGLVIPHSDGISMQGFQAALLDRGRSLVAPTNAELLQYGSSGKSSDEKKRKGRSSTEFALALHQPHRFIAKEVEKQLSAHRTPGTENILSILRSQGVKARYDEEFDSSVLERKKSSRKVTNHATGEAETIETSSPGALEQVGIAITALLDDSEIAVSADTIILAPLSKLLREYRIHSGHRQELPEMPDLTQALLDRIGNFPGNRRVRYGIYGILEQIQVPLTMQEEIAERMDKNKDLDHPLAFQVTRDLAERKPDSQWIVTQQERREHMLTQLQGSNQELFERFYDLLDLSQGLVYHDDPLHPHAGKVGIEVELRINNLIHEKAQLEGQHETAASHEAGLDRDQWTMGLDMTEEVRKTNTPSSLEHGQEYLSSLVHLYKWFGDYASKIHSIHFHFDRDRHPYLPGLGHLLDGSTIGRAGNSSVAASSRHPTYEIRGIFPPRADGNIHPARIEDVIGMYLSATQADTTYSVGDKLQLDPDKRPTVKQLTWGHIVTFLQKPQGRLAALMALHDTVALANVNPLAFANSVDKSSLPHLIESIEDKFKAPTDVNMLEALRIYTQEEDWLLSLEEFPEFYLMRDVLGVQGSNIAPDRPIYVDENYQRIMSTRETLGLYARSPRPERLPEERNTRPPIEVHRNESLNSHRSEEIFRNETPSIWEEPLELNSEYRHRERHLNTVYNRFPPENFMEERASYRPLYEERLNRIDRTTPIIVFDADEHIDSINITRNNRG